MEKQRVEWGDDNIAYVEERDGSYYVEVLATDVLTAKGDKAMATKDELKRAMDVASSDRELGFDGLEIFDGFGLPNFAPVYVTLTQIARLMRWQAMQLNGQWDMEALGEVCRHARRRFLVIGQGN